MRKNSQKIIVRKLYTYTLKKKKYWVLKTVLEIRGIFSKTDLTKTSKCLFKRIRKYNFHLQLGVIEERA